MRSPVLSLDGKKNALVALFGSEISPSMLNLLKVLVDRQRIGILDAVLGRFLELYRELRGITLATVTSATALSTEQQQKLTEKVKALAGTNSVEVDINVDPTVSVTQLSRSFPLPLTPFSCHGFHPSRRDQRHPQAAN
jgi:F-type H+-transporting ATPase subunit delta